MDFAKNYDTIRDNREFQFLFRKGKSHVTHGFVCYYGLRKSGGNGKNRLGIVASKKIGNAVKRNRAKRVIREAFRLAEPRLKQRTDKHYDFVFVARGKTPYLKSAQVYGLIEALFDKL